MYCRQCKYDLRGQTVPRCPECGRAFIPGDTTTYFEATPTWRSRLLPRLRWLSPLVPTALLLVCYSILLPGLSFGGELLVGIVAGKNLNAIVKALKSEAHGGGEILIMSPLHLQDRVSASLSPFSQSSELRKRLRLEFRMGFRIKRDAWLYSAVFFVYFLIVAVLVRGAYRRWPARLAVVALVAFTSTFGQELASWWIPGDYSYLSDYEFVAGRDGSSQQGGEPAIIAYAVSPHRYLRFRSLSRWIRSP